jgi:hypothetical protein
MKENASLASQKSAENTPRPSLRLRRGMLAEFVSQENSAFYVG